jgi:dTDP-4-amino-4,6-dideoxygalactose transaminase
LTLSSLIPFHRPYVAGQELVSIAEACLNAQLSGDGPFTKRCYTWLEQQIHCHKALLTHSATAALEMAALFLNLKPGDEVIMPSYTFVFSANSFVLRGAVLFY